MILNHRNPSKYRDNMELRERLCDMLRYRRPANSAGEVEFIEKYLSPVEGINVDGFGNYWIQIGDKPTTLFSCHTDTVHDGPMRSRWNKDKKVVEKTECAHGAATTQDVYVDEGYTRAFRGEDAVDCLGADDTCGIFIMLEMIDNKVPGLYIFHREEETGGQGSSYIVADDAWKMRLQGLKRAIAFDRCGLTSVITHQGFGRCCSDKFAYALAAELNQDFKYLDYKPDDTGVFTDTANYTHLIPECTNLSVGFYKEHTANEYVDIDHLMSMLWRCLLIDWEGLPTVRDPADKSIDDRSRYGSWLNQYSGTQDDREYRDVAKRLCFLGVSELAEFCRYLNITEDDIDSWELSRLF